ncbi:MAG: phosphomethylpyrimidine synthase ThiC [Deltaproteobacteria bacterium]|nr:phosphomethylpyrimidine synthase ThiC [Deltaproteobacteria bacterium]
MTQLESALKGIVTPEMSAVAADEGHTPEDIRRLVAQGVVVIPANVNHKGLKPRGIGAGLTIKVNANIGTSYDRVNVDEEMDKLQVAVEAGADAFMDLSTGGDIADVRRRLLAASDLPMGTVPIYQAVIEVVQKHGGIVNLTADHLFDVIERQAEEGVDFVTVHCGVTQETLKRLKNQGRETDIVSRGGAFLTTWMLYHKKENPLYEQYDRLLDIARKYDLTLSLGDGLRPGCIADATDRAQVQELIFLGELSDAARQAGVQVMIEGPGHVPLNQIETNIQLEKKLCGGAPFYVLGPLVTDVASGYDHIACAIGGTLAGLAGADFLCYVTPAEHLKLPSVQDVRDGVIASKIAAHAADVARGHPQALARDLAMARARKRLDWDEQIRLSVDPINAAACRRESYPEEEDVCTMCGPYCAIKLVKEYFGEKK